MSRLTLIVFFTIGTAAAAAEPFRLDRCELVPLPQRQVSLQVNGMEKTRWHFDHASPRPFFFPLNGPSGVSLTRMGHPGAANHDHHRSVWFAHQNVDGHDFWADGKGTYIRQRHWSAYEDGDDEAIMATALDWYDADGRLVLQQELVAALVPLDKNEHALEFQISFRPPTEKAAVSFGKTNFGFLAVRVAKTLSPHFGGGKLTNSEGQSGEKQIFGNRARWMDYSGPIAVGRGTQRQAVFEGVTYFDHPDNPRYPTRWHVRQDGWMGASFCMDEQYTVANNHPLTLRYLLYAHAGRYDHDKTELQHKAFVARPGFEIAKAKVPHRHFEVKRK